jgi:hypothetical protein
VSDDTQQPTSIDAQEYARFREFVGDVHGKVRGNLSTEMENALREYRETYYGTDRIVRIEDDVAAIKAMLADGDGGSTLPSRSDETHTDTESDDRSGAGGDGVPDEPPHPRASRARKAEWLASTFDLGSHPKDAEVPRVAFESKIDDEYAFGPEPTEQLIDAAANRLDLEPHPNKPETRLVGEDRAYAVADDDADEGDDADDDPDPEAVAVVDTTFEDIEDAKPATGEEPPDDEPDDDSLVADRPFNTDKPAGEE